jgi:hypothetical protein
VFDVLLAVNRLSSLAKTSQYSTSSLTVGSSGWEHWGVLFPIPRCKRTTLLIVVSIFLSSITLLHEHMFIVV